MVGTMNYPMTRQGVRDLDNPIRPNSSGVNVGPDERAASTLAGAVLAGIGLGRGGLVGLLFAAAGGALAYRGVTGHCSAYATAGINTAR
jgi:uncharacterized membrane protein